MELCEPEVERGARARSASVHVPGNFTTGELAGVLGVDRRHPAERRLARRGAARQTGRRRARCARKLAQLAGSARFQGTRAGQARQLRHAGRAGRTVQRQRLRQRRPSFDPRRDLDDQCRARDGAGELRQPQRELADPPAAGLAPPIRGLHIGQVKQVAEDPNGDLRVLVTLPLIASEDGRLGPARPVLCLDGFGSAFFPEVGDEVVLGFMDEDPANPVILASVYSAPARADRPAQRGQRRQGSGHPLEDRDQLRRQGRDPQDQRPRAADLARRQGRNVKVADPCNKLDEMAKRTRSTWSAPPT